MQDPLLNLGFLLHEVTRLMRRNLDRRVRHLGLTQAQWRALSYLARHEGVSQTALADLLEVRPITLGRLVDRMQESGWVVRESDPTDRRACRLRLTERAQPLLEEVRALAAQTRAEATAGIPAAARRQLIDALSLMKHNLLAAEAAGDEAAQMQAE